MSSNICGRGAGLVCYLELYFGALDGFQAYLKVKNSGAEEVPLLNWHPHCLQMVFASLGASALAAYIAGAVSRTRGGAVGAFSSVPVVWFWCRAILHTLADPEYAHNIKTSTAIAVITLVIATLPLAVVFGRSGAIAGAGQATHFDSRPRSLLGVSWYHLPWIFLLASAFAADVQFSISYVVEWLWAYLLPSSPLVSLLAYAYITGLVASTYLLLRGPFMAYRVLAGFEQEGSALRRAWLVAKYAIGWPMCALGIRYLGLALNAVLVAASGN